MISTNTIFSDIKYKELVDLFNNISKFTFYTLNLVSGEFNYDSYRMKCRSLLGGKASSGAIEMLDPDEYKNLNDECLYVNVLYSAQVKIHLIFDINATYDEPILKSKSKIFNDSVYNMIVLADGRAFEDNTNSLDNILYIEKVIKKVLLGLTTNGKIASDLSKLFCHILFNYEDEWIFIKSNEDMVLSCIQNKHSTPIEFNYERDHSLIECIEKICLPEIVN